jgi:hypothetical protein
MGNKTGVQVDAGMEHVMLTYMRNKGSLGLIRVILFHRITCLSQ